MRTATAQSPDRPARPPGAGLPARIRGPRFVGMAIGSLCVGAALVQHGAPAWAWILVALQVLAWPQAAFLMSSRSATPREAEYRNLLLDAVFCAFWLPAIGFNVLPSAVVLALVTMDCGAVGGVRLLLRGLAAEGVGLLLGWGVFGWHPEYSSNLATILACLPVLILYPLTVGLVMYRLSARLIEGRKAMERSERLYRDTLDAMEAGIVLYDAQDRMVLCNDTFRRLHPAIDELLVPGQPQAAIWRAAVDAGLVAEAEGREAEWLAERARGAAAPAREAHTQRFPGDRWRRVLDRRLSDGGLLSFSTDITDLVRREHDLQRLNAERDEVARQLQAVNQQLELLSQTDALTGVANRRLFDLRLKHEWQRGRRHGWWLSLAMIDVDHFKRYNDRHGHLEGDACLRRVAQALQGSAHRTSDLVARYGGEEFVVVLPHTTLDDATALAQRLLAAVDADAIAHEDSPVGPRVTVSIGVASVLLDVESGDDAVRLVRAADRALYRAKAQGRHRVAAATAEDDDRLTA